MASHKSIWYQLGLAYERARLGAGHPEADRAPGAVDRRAGDAGRPARLEWPLADELFSAAAWLVLDRVLAPTAVRRRPGVLDLVRAGAAGAAAAFLLDLLHPLLTGDRDARIFDARTADRILAGIAQGLVYGAVIEPRVPGPALLKGALYGSAEFATDPGGGLGALLGRHTPQGRIPGLGDALQAMTPHDRAFVEHVVFGIALALLYEPDEASRGTTEDDAEG